MKKRKKGAKFKSTKSTKSNTALVLEGIETEAISQINPPQQTTKKTR